ncbi:MAG: hypothetical protein KAS53_09100 [Candidatus Cloacimonetes bacterium]|nr:hypothetical protein [Candidatus Cloacimonadota bacterium]
MKILILVLVLLISLNLSALANVRLNNYNSNLTENISHKFSTIENEKAYTKSTNTNYLIKQGEKLNVYNLNGSIKFIGWNKHYIKITAIKKVFRNCCDLNDLHMTLNTLNGLSIETINNSNDSRARIDYIINVPRNILFGEIFTRGNIKVKNLPNDIIGNIRRLSNR